MYIIKNPIKSDINVRLKADKCFSLPPNVKRIIKEKIKMNFLKILISFQLLYLIDCTSEKSTGGVEVIDINDSTVEGLLKEHLSKIKTGSGASFEVLKKTKVTQQVVAGISYTISGLFKVDNDEKECVVTIWTRPWIKTNEKLKIKAECSGKLYLEKDDTGDW